MTKMILSAFCLLLKYEIIYAEELSPSSAVSYFLNNNFDLQINQSKAKQKEGEIEKAWGEFDSQISARYAHDYKETPRATSLDTTGNAKAVKSITKEHEIKFQKKFTWGTDVTLPYKYNIVDSDSTFRVFRESHEPSLSITLKQAMIKPFFEGYNSRDIENAQAAQLVQLEKNKGELDDKTMKIIEQYLDIYEKNKQLKLYKLTLDSAKKNYEYSEQKKKLGRGSLVEELEALSAYKKAEEKVLTQTLTVANAKMDLGQQIFGELNKKFEIPEDLELPPIPPLPSRINELFSRASENRAQAVQQQIEIKNNQNKKRLAQVDKLPDLDLEAKYESKGLDRDLSEGNKDVLHRDYPTWRISLNVKRPIFQYATNGQSLITEQTLTQSQLENEKTKQEIFFEIMSSIRSIKQEQKILRAMELSKNAEQNKVDYFNKRYYAGQINFLELKKAIEAYEKSELELLKSKVRLTKSWYQLQKSQGLLLSSLKI